MLFNSLTYVLFLVVVVVLYWALPQRNRLWLIFIASCVFYGFWRLEFLPLLLFSAALDYYLALWIERTEEERQRKRLVIISVVVNLAILGFFKYLVFFKVAMWSGAEFLGYEPSFVELKIILPLGISFYIFATISYVIDVYRREFPAEKDFLVYSCFVVFFPHLVAGPILRARSLMPQLRRPDAFHVGLLSSGVSRIVAGLFLKVCFADPIGAMVDLDFQRDPQTLSALDVWTISFLFGFQIYFDFAGYSHIAIGSSKLMGIHLPENFDYPYMSSSPREFWRRWHISLSTWIRDYVYLPMAGGYQRDQQRAFEKAPVVGLPELQASRTPSLYFTWALMGFWHGANWTFVVWGVFHAVVVHVHRMLSSWKLTRQIPFADLKTAQALGWLVTLPLMMAAWIPFRSTTLEQTFGLWGRLVLPQAYFSLSLLLDRYVTAIVVLAMMILAYLAEKRVLPLIDRQAKSLRFVVSSIYYAVAMAFVIVFLQVRTQFIYFQF
jgi:alginate O-acetyltransferase complex protein AlgI